MSKELADRLEQWLKWTILNRQEKQLLNEAIAALRNNAEELIASAERVARLEAALMKIAHINNSPDNSHAEIARQALGGAK